MKIAAVMLSLFLCAVAHQASAQSNDAVAPVAPPPTLGPVIQPAPESEYGRGVEPLPQPNIAQPAPLPEINSPVTGYGPGGMQQPPGTPANPPYIGRPFTVGH